MREILFRGKRKDNGEWVYGCVLQADNWSDISVIYNYDGSMYEPPLFDFDSYEVIPETVGQYTGLTDKNGKEIYEGDIVHAIYKSGYTGIPDRDFGIGVIRYNGTYYGGAAYQIDIIGEPGRRVFSASLQVEVIGNVHDNPELLEGE